MSLARNGLRVGLASLLLLAGAKSVHDASAVGDTRTLTFHHTHSGEDLTVTFKRSGRYDEDALKQINHFLRDWRSQDSTTMDRRLFDILWEVYRDVDGKQPIQIISAYRSPSTNAMLRRRSSGVARFSQHMLGHAMDFFIPGVPLEQIRFAGLRLQRGGVGFYPTSGSPFVHLDTGSIRHWPRMTHDQLARVFPDGRTVHVPSDGAPLKGYQLALADIERRGKDGDTGASKPGFFASLFSRKPQPQDDGEDEAGANDADAGTKPTPTAVAAARLADSVPLPRAKPASAKYQVASAATQPVALKSASDQTPSTESRPQTPADIINARGFWDNDAFASKPATPQQIAALRARSAVTPDPQSTASLPPAVSQAMAYAPASPPLDRSQIVAASAPIPRSLGSALRTTGQATATRDLDQSAPITTATRLTAAKTNDAWVRAMILTPSASNALLATVLGDQDMTLMRAHFVKPDKIVVMGFTDDPQMGVICERFTGSAVAMLATQSFVMRTASLR